jgi:uncharacterized protein (DUF924 family)
VYGPRMFEEVLAFWFGPLDERGCADQGHREHWWRKDTAFDDEIRRRFADELAAIRRGERDEWLATPRGRLAQVIVLDQFSRNIFGGSAQSFAADPQARRVVDGGLQRGDDQQLALDERSFFYMPFMHSEEMAHQDRAVALFAGLRDSAPPDVRDSYGSFVQYAEQHRNIVRRFGRFPHRNAILGRTTTPDEMLFLEQAGSSF